MNKPKEQCQFCARKYEWASLARHVLSCVKLPEISILYGEYMTEPVSAVAKRYGVSAAFVRRRITDAGYTPKSKKKRYAEEERILAEARRVRKARTRRAKAAKAKARKVEAARVEAQYIADHPMVTCGFCPSEWKRRSIKRHEATCQKMPDGAALYKEYLTTPAYLMGIKYGVGRSTIELKIKAFGYNLGRKRGKLRSKGYDDATCAHCRLLLKPHEIAGRYCGFCLNESVTISRSEDDE